MYIPIVYRAFPFAPLASEQRAHRKVLQVPLSLDPMFNDVTEKGYNDGGALLAHKGPNKQDDNSASTYYFQLPSRRVQVSVCVCIHICELALTYLALSSTHVIISTIQLHTIP